MGQGSYTGSLGPILEDGGSLQVLTGSSGTFFQNRAAKQPFSSTASSSDPFVERWWFFADKFAGVNACKMEIGTKSLVVS